MNGVLKKNRFDLPNAVMNSSSCEAMKSTNKILKASLIKLSRYEMAFIIPVITNVEELDSFFTSDMAISLIPNVATTLSEYSLTSCLYTCKDYSAIGPSEAELCSGRVHAADF